MKALRQVWTRSRAYRAVLVVALLYAVLRLLVHCAYLVMLLSPDQNVAGGLPGWAEVERPMLPVDLQVYLDAARRFQVQKDLYLTGPVTRLEDLYQYAPSFALAFTPFLYLPLTLVAATHTSLHLGIYALLYLSWHRIFHRLEFTRASKMLAWTLPLWLLFPDFWSDLGYLNIYVAMALLSTLLIEAILERRLGWSVLWLSLILQTKPQWAVVAAAALFLGRRRFFFKLIGLGTATYATTVGLTALLSNPVYTLGQYADYVSLLSRLSDVFPWRGPETNFLGYNHSIKQVVVYLLGVKPGTLRLATSIKILVLTPFAMVGLNHIWRAVGRSNGESSLAGLDAAFALYLAAFIWLDMVWEVSLGIVIFTYLLATVRHQGLRVAIWAVFLPYALVDVLRLLGAVLASFGMRTLLPGPYVLTDISMHIPIVMVVILTFYAVLVRRLWITASAERATGAIQWTWNPS